MGSWLSNLFGSSEPKNGTRNTKNNKSIRQKRSSESSENAIRRIQGEVSSQQSNLRRNDAYGSSFVLPYRPKNGSNNEQRGGKRKSVKPRKPKKIRRKVVKKSSRKQRKSK